ncbi:MAG: hypothetical protein Q8O35_05720 [Humidesulfovibrio sp.]|uniref:hypothetical protein n=1 Tax=Humidesulfovibrio sp. TaxID=2910988 RepID=UPI0027331CAB|nr:hypothetical protein [Humidesulfovibrio sp.]MDP2847677.1 hypothetical protein [Humidesulfovibrio sp.]
MSNAHITEHQTSQVALPLDLFRVYEATDPFSPAPYRVTLRLSREKRLLEDISSGRSLLRLGRLVLETRELALARAQSQAFYL